MPTKLKQSSQTYNRATGKTTTEHYYMKNQSVETLFEELNKGNRVKPQKSILFLQ